MVKNDGVRGVASWTLGMATEQIQNAARLVKETGLSKALVRTAELSGLPDSPIARAATSALRLPLDKLKLLRPPQAEVSADVPDLPREILDNIADHLDRKTLSDFALGSSQFAQVAGGAVRDLTFNSPDKLRKDMASLADEPQSRFSQRGLHSLTLTHGRYDSKDLDAIPEWARASIQSLVLERPLAEDGWPLLENFPKLREVKVLQSEGYGEADLARLPKSLARLHLRMPATEEVLDQLKQFPGLKEIEVTMAHGSRLDDVLEQFGLSGSSAEDTEAKDTQHDGVSSLRNIKMTALTFHHGQSFAESDIAKLPASLRELTLPWQCQLSTTAFKQLGGIRLQSLDASQSPNLSGASLQAVLQHPTLRRFRSAASNLTASDAKEIAASPRLQEVELPYNDRIGDDGIKSLLANTRINVLNIARCGGSDRLLMDLARKAPPHLEDLTLMG